MKKIFYWSPYLSNVATIRNVINSAHSLIKYDYDSYKVGIVDAVGEWQKIKNKIFEKRIGYYKINGLNLSSKLPITGFLKSRIYFILIFFVNFFPLKNLLKKEKPDFLIIHLLTSLPLCLLLFFNFNTNFILRISGLPKLNLFRKILWKITGKKLFLITCPTEETKEEIIKLNIFDPKKIVLLYDPIINVAEITKKKKEFINKNDLNKNYFLSIGRLTPQKNHTLLIKLFSLLQKDNKNILLYILGDGEEKNNIIKEINKLNLQKNIFLLGHKENVYPYIQSANAIVSASLWEDPGAVMIESAFCNKIVISSNCPSGPTEFLKNGQAGYLFKNNNIELLKNSVDNFFQDSLEVKKEKQIMAKKSTKNYTIFNHYIIMKKILN